MARLSAAARRKIPKSKYAIPSKAPKSGSYPINDPNHARAALSMVARHGSSSEKARVRAAVKRRYPTIGRSKGKKK